MEPLSIPGERVLVIRTWVQDNGKSSIIFHGNVPQALMPEFMAAANNYVQSVSGLIHSNPTRN